MQEQPKNPLHGMTLEAILKRLVEVYGWESMGERIKIRCFQENPSVDSSLKFLRKTPWARGKVEMMYVRMIVREARAAEKEKARASREAPTQDPNQELPATELAEGASDDRS